MKISFLKIIGIFLFLASSGKLQADPLSPLAIYAKCYAQITQMRVGLNDARTLAVVSGTKNPITACLEVLDRAKLSGANGALSDVNDPIAKSVLRTFFDLHSSWLTSKEIPSIGGGSSTNARDIYDTRGTAFYFTKALLAPSTPYNYVVTTLEYLEALRTTQDPLTGAYTDEDPSTYVIGQYRLAATGELLGIRVGSSMNAEDPDDGVIHDLAKMHGGGALGSPYFLNTSVSETWAFKADGGVEMPRRWGKAVFKDFLCRDIPVVRHSDADPYVVATSSVPFRTNRACVSCHASMDRLSATIGNLIFSYYLFPIQTPTFPTPSYAAAEQWPSEPDSNYYRRPASGVFYMRDYNGQLIDKNIDSLATLGTEISNTDDYYICAAKRYYEYFLGLQVDTGDLASPEAKREQTSVEIRHRDLVVTMGKNLKQHQSLRTLIEEILRLSSYANTDPR